MSSFKLPLRWNHRINRLSRYWKALKWLVSDSMWRFRSLVILSILSGFLAVSLRISTLGLTLTYARSLEEGLPIAFFGHYVDPQPSIAILVFFSLSFLILLVGSALLQYISNTTAIKASLSYESYCYQRIIKILASQAIVWNLEKERLSNKAYLKRLATKDSRFLGISLRNLIKILIPLAEIFVYITFLFLLNYRLTLLILLLLSCSTAIFYQINSIGAKSSKQMEQYSPGATREASLIIDRMLKFPLPESSVGPYLENYLTDSFFSCRQSAYGDRLFSVAKAGVLAEIIAASSIFLIFMTLGGNSIIRGSGWGELLAYFIILRALNSSVSSASKSFTVLNRFYPHFKRYASFVNQAIISDKHTQNHFQKNVCIDLASPFRKFKGYEKIALREGNMLALIAPLRLDVFSLQDIKVIISANPDSEVDLSVHLWLATSDYQGLPVATKKKQGQTRWQVISRRQKQQSEFISGSLSDKLSNLVDTQQAIKVLLSYNFPDEFLSRACDLLTKENNLQPEASIDLSGVSRDLKFTLALLVGHFSNKQIIVFSQEDWFLFSEEVRHGFLEILSDRLLITVFVDNLDRISYSGSNFVAIADNKNRLLDFGSTSWFNKNFPKIMRYLSNKPLQHGWLTLSDLKEKEELIDEEDEED